MKGIKKSVLSFVLTLSMAATQNAGFLSHAQETKATDNVQTTNIQNNTKTDFTFKNKDLKLTAKANQEANLPEDSEIKAEALNNSSQYKDAVKKFNNSNYDYTLYNVHIVKDNKDIEPEKGQVEVNITLNSPIKMTNDHSLKDSYIIHLNKDKSEKLKGKINTNTNGDITSFSFKTGSFSPIGLAIKKNEKTVSEKASLKVAAENETNMPQNYDLSGSQSSWVKSDESYLKVENENGDKVLLQQNVKIPEYASFEMKIAFKVPDHQENDHFDGVQSSDKIIYQVPEWVRGFKNTSGNLSGNKGTWKLEKINDKNYIVLQFSDSFLNNNHYGFDGELSLEGTMNDTTSATTEKKTTIRFLGTEYSDITPTKRIKGGIANIKLKKTVGDKTSIDGVSGVADAAIKSVHYTLDVKAGDFNHPENHNNTDIENIVVDDAFKTYEKYDFTQNDFTEESYFEKYITYQNINVKITGPDGTFDVYKDGNSVTAKDGRSVTITDGDKTASKKIKLNGVLHPDEDIIIDYDANINEEMYEDHPLGNFKAGSNKSSDTQPGDIKYNAVDNQGGERSWIARRASNTATVTSNTNGVESKDTETIEKKNQDDTDWYLNFEKTWLYKGADVDGKGPLKGHISHWQISVNEGNRMPISGYVLEDDLDQHFDTVNNVKVKKSSTLISGITVTDEDDGTKVIDHISLDDVKNNNISDSSPWHGTTTKNIKYTFPSGSSHHYRFHFITKGDEQTTGEIEAFNSATLREPGNVKGDKEDDYGVARHWTTPGATVTKGVVSTDVDHGLIHWKTTIDAGISVKKDSQYRDYVFFEKTDREYTRSNSNKDTYTDTTSKSRDANADDKKIHEITQDTLHLNITAGEGDNKTTLQLGTDYHFHVLSDDEVTKRDKGGRFGDGFTSGFQITFNRDITGPVIITYDSKAGFDQVNYSCNFENIMGFKSQPSDSEFVDATSVNYTADGTLKKTVESIEDNKIKWDLRINETKHPTKAGYVLKDTIPEGLNFDLHDLSPAQYIYDTDQETGIWANDDLINSFKNGKITTTSDGTQEFKGEYFDASYNKDTRELKLIIHEKAANRAFTYFQYTTSVSAAKLKEVLHSNDKKVQFINSASLYSNGQGQPKLQESSAWAWIQPEVLDKKYTYSKETAPYVNYTITVNKNSAELSPDDHQLIVQDNGIKAPLQFVHDGDHGLKVIDKDGHEYTEDDHVNAEKHTYKFTKNGDNGFKLIVPDATRLIISYSAYAPGIVGDEINTGNSVTLYAGKESISSSSAGKAEAFVEPSGNAFAANRIKVHKVDEKTNANLAGATFKIYKATGNDYSQTDGEAIGTITTGENGIARTYVDGASNNINLENDTVYLLKEVTAPGYNSDNHYAYYAKNNQVRKFYFIPAHPNDDQKRKVNDLRANHKDVTLINQGFVDYEDLWKDQEIALTTVKATKNWDDDNNRDNKRTAITLHLSATIKKDGKDIALTNFINPDAIKDKTVSNEDVKKGNSQTVTWDNLPKTDAEGNTITYKVTENASPSDYTSEVTGNADDGFTVTNSHTPATVTVEGQKIWDDADYKGKNGYQRPEEIEVTLNGTADGKKIESLTKIQTVKADNNWTYEFKNLPEYQPGQVGKKVTYTVSETKVDGKKPSEAGYESTVNGTDITNTPKKYENDDITPVQLTITKKDGKSDKHGVLAGAEFKAVKDGESITATTDANGQATLNFKEPGTYTLTETKAPEGYEISDNLKKGLKVEVTKSAADKVELKVENNTGFFQWFYHLFFGSDKDQYAYDYNEDTHSGVLELTNDPRTTKVTAEKVWDDKDNQDGLRKDVTLHLSKTVDDKTAEVSSKTIKADATGDDLKATWDNLPAYEDGKKISYSITEDKIDGYESKVDGDESKGFRVTNTHTPKSETPTTPQMTKNDTPKTPETPKNEMPTAPTSTSTPTMSTTTTTAKKPKTKTQSKDTTKESNTDTESNGGDVGSGKNGKNADTEANSDSENENGGHNKGSYRTDDSNLNVHKGSETNAQNSQSPKTGDMTNIDLYLALLAIATITIIVILKKFKFMNH